jgi:hypothetical protein
MSSVSSRHGGSSQISKIYRQASNLFLTRRLPEALSTILPVITTPADSDGALSAEAAPIASASRTTRIKVWSLYLTILNAIVELDPEEGKETFGAQDWRALVSKVREGEVWEEVVQNGYSGVEGNVDSDVVINLATLLLAHARTQTLNQQRLESYLAAASRPNLDMSGRFDDLSPSGIRSPRKAKSGTDTPRDLNARVKILELYTLHVLLRNNEWDYAREFITMSEVLDEERREAFLQALQSLQDEQNEVARQEREAQRREEEELQREIEEGRKRREAEERERQMREEQERQERASVRTAGTNSSEVDYGIEPQKKAQASNGSANGSAKGRASNGKTKRNGGTVSHTSRPSNSKAVGPPSMLRRVTAIMSNIGNLVEAVATHVQSSPLILIRTLAFIITMLLILSNKKIKERVQRLLGTGWGKVKATAGMGVKVSYI